MKNKVIVGVLGLPINNKGEYLLALRNDPGRPKSHNKWEIVGGGLEYGESFEECLAREFEEEIGITPKILFPYPIIFTKKRNDKQNSVLVLACYLVSIGKKQPVPNHEEILDVKWFSPQLLQKLDSLDLTNEFVHEIEQIRINYALDTVLQYNHR